MHAPECGQDFGAGSRRLAAEIDGVIDGQRRITRSLGRGDIPLALSRINRHVPICGEQKPIEPGVGDSQPAEAWRAVLDQLLRLAELLAPVVDESGRGHRRRGAGVPPARTWYS